jgi:pyruvyltransferase
MNSAGSEFERWVASYLGNGNEEGSRAMQIDSVTVDRMREIAIPFVDGNPLSEYLVDEGRLLLTEDGEVPLIHWPVAPNFGDLLSPWLISKITGRETFQNRGEGETYIAIGSVIKRVGDQTSVWGTGSFGDERKKQLNTQAKYYAVRGPLTRVKLSYAGIQCPRVYGDPALLAPYFYTNNQQKRFKTGFVIRWSDKFWKNLEVGDDTTVIDLKTDDIEGTLDRILQCEKIVTSSLHGLIIADAYGIPSAWVESSTPRGGEFKYYDYFLSVDKVRHAQIMPKGGLKLTEEWIASALEFDGRPITFDPYALLDACPFLNRK